LPFALNAVQGFHTTARVGGYTLTE